MRAVKGSLGHSLKERHKKPEGTCWTRAVGDQSGHPVGYGRDIGRPDRYHPQRLWENDVIDDLKGQVSKRSLPFVFFGAVEDLGRGISS